MTGALAAALGFTLALAAALALVVISLRRKNAALGRRIELNEAELERLQRSFARFAPAELVERIAGDGQAGAGERREVTVMFADIRGFTRTSEHLDPAVVVEMLNGYFREMSAAIQAHHGHVTRLMGDGLMSVFGALRRNPWHVQDAVEAAVAMRRALAGYNRRLSERGLPELSFGIGIHTGSVVAGLVGSEELQEFTVMGDPVNVASRVEALTRELPADILLTDEVRRHLGERFALRQMAPAAIRGKSRPVLTWALEAG